MDRIVRHVASTTVNWAEPGISAVKETVLSVEAGQDFDFAYQACTLRHENREPLNRQ